MLSVFNDTRYLKKALNFAGMSVTKSVPAYAIVAGVPARIIGDTRENREQAGQT